MSASDGGILLPGRHDVQAAGAARRARHLAGRAARRRAAGVGRGGGSGAEAGSRVGRRRRGEFARSRSRVGRLRSGRMPDRHGLLRRSTRAVLAAMGVAARFRIPGPRGMDYVHRRAGDADIYFVRNTQARAAIRRSDSACRGKEPELWHPDTGETEPQPVYDFTADGRTRLPLGWSRTAACFVVLRHAGGRALAPDDRGWCESRSRPRCDLQRHPDHARRAGRYTLVRSDGQTLAADVAEARLRRPSQPWTVRFTPGWGAPPASLSTAGVLDREPRSGHPLLLRHGHATRRRFFLECLKGAHPLFSTWATSARSPQVKVNGKTWESSGRSPSEVVWERQQTRLERTGNRGDQSVAQSPDRRSAPAARKTPDAHQYHQVPADSPLMPSGLLGPVTIVQHSPPVCVLSNREAGISAAWQIGWNSVEAVLALIEKKRGEKQDASLGASLEEFVLDSQVRELEQEILENPGAIEPSAERPPPL